jgi:hypothetical protein
MKRLLAIIASAALSVAVLGLGPAVSPVAAVGPVACGDSGAVNYSAGERAAAGLHPTGARATVDPPSGAYFNTCTPNDSSLNAAVAGVGVKDLGTGQFVYLQLIDCINDPRPFCDGTLHLVGEWKGLYSWDYGTIDFGNASNGNLYEANELKVNWNAGDGQWNFWFNGDYIGYKSGVMNPAGGLDIRAQWWGEVYDRGSSLSDSDASPATNFSNVGFRYPDGTWKTIGNGGSCDFNYGGQVRCNVNGGNGFYVWTDN